MDDSGNTPARCRRILLWLCRGLIAIVLLKGGWDMAWRVWFEWHGAYNGDSGVYWAVGRGIVNGFKPYVDLFEIKPPMIFLIPALSYWLTDSMIIGHIVSGLMIVGVSAFLFLAALPILKRVPRNRPESLALILLGIAGSLVLGLYAGARSGEFQTELFGAFFACGYVMIVAQSVGRATPLRGMLAGLFFGAAVMTKEPFVITTLTGGLLLVRSKRDALWLLVVPLVVAGLFSLALLASVGGLKAYMTDYLDFVVNRRVERFGSPWGRGLMAERVWKELTIYSIGLTLLIGGLWGSAWILSVKRAASRTSWHAAGAALLIGGFFLALHRLRSPLSPDPETIAAAILLMAGAVIMMRSVTMAWNRYLLAWEAILLVATVYIVTYAGGLSGEFHGHHMVFAVPVYGALLARIIRAFEVPADRMENVMLGLLAILAFLSVILSPHFDARARLETIERNGQFTRAVARELDDVLDACGEAQYQIVPEPFVDVFAFTKHSPMGRAFFHYAFIMYEPVFLQSFAEHLQIANVIVYKPGGRPIYDELQRYVDTQFTTTPPTCAAPYIDAGKEYFRFRSGWNPERR